MAAAPDELSQLALFASGPVVLFKWRNEEGWPVEWVSPNVESVFGRTATDFMSGEVSYAEMVHDRDIERVGKEVADAQAQNLLSFEHEPYRILHPNGSVRWLQDVTHLHRDDGTVTHFVGYVVDITERLEATRRQHALQLEHLHSQKMESLGVLAGGVAHDFNNLLTGILGEANLASMSLAEGGGDIAQSLHNIETLASRAADLTRQLLAYSGKGKFVVESTDLSLLIREISQMLNLVVSKKASLQLNLAADLPAIEADRGQLQQIVMNLLTNASEALGGEAGAIRMSTHARDYTAEALERDFGAAQLEPGRYVGLEVSDDGCGMTPEVRSRLFEPFFTTKADGRGLGMSAILGIVKAHGGAIQVRSEPGEGTAFKLVFPASKSTAPAVSSDPASDGWKGHGTALIVDDETPVRDVAARLMRRLGFETIVASNGQVGLERFSEHRGEIRIVLLDMVMPVMGGRETLAALRQLKPDLPIVLLSGFDEEETISRLAARGSTSFLQKPFLAADLESAVRRALG